MNETEHVKSFDELCLMIQHEALDAGINSYFNNFRLNLPHPNRPLVPEVVGKPSIRPRDMINFFKEPGLLDRTIKTIWPADIGEFSQLLAGQTYRDFFLTIDQLVDELQLNDAIENYYRLEKEDPQRKAAHREAFHIDMLPLYVTLLQMGYNKDDLTK